MYLFLHIDNNKYSIIVYFRKLDNRIFEENTLTH